jgi:hypothetical protein
MFDLCIGVMYNQEFEYRTIYLYIHDAVKFKKI